MKKTIFYAIPLLLALAAGCQEKEEPLVVETNTTSMTFQYFGGTHMFYITANGEWEVEKSEGADWLSIDPSKGTGRAFVNVTAEKYQDVGRTATLTLKSSEGTVCTISVLQTGPVLPEKPFTETIRARAYEQDVFVPAVSGFVCKLEVDPESADIASYAGETDGGFMVHIAENAGTENREIKARILTSDGNMLENVSIIQSWKNVEAGELLIDEIFFAGYMPEGSTIATAHDGDQYIRITNAASETVYADGLLIASGVTNSQNATWVYPELPDSIGVSTIYTIPGSGKDVPVEPGKSIIIAVAAQNFTDAGGCNLTVADFEMYDDNDIYPDIDNPDVANLGCWFKASATVTTIHMRGMESLAIAVAPKTMTAEAFMEACAWHGKRVMDFNGYHFEQTIKDSYLIPNEWVVDGVNLAVQEDLGTLWFNASIDAGYTNVSTIDRDPERYGKAVRRISLADTDNSTNDFEIVTPSLK